MDSFMLEQFKALPQQIQDVIVSDEFHLTIKDIGERHQLNSEQVTGLENETVLVMAGLEPLVDLSQNLEREVGITKEQADKILIEVEALFIHPIEETLYKFIEKQLAEETGVDVPATSIQRVQIDRTSRNTSVSQTQNTPPPITEPKESPTATPQRDVPQTDQTSILKVLRENGKTLNIKNIIENLK